MRVGLAILVAGLFAAIVTRAAPPEKAPPEGETRPPTQGIVPFNPGADLLGIGPRAGEPWLLITPRGRFLCPPGIGDDAGGDDDGAAAGCVPVQAEELPEAPTRGGAEEH